MYDLGIARGTARFERIRPEATDAEGRPGPDFTRMGGQDDVRLHKANSLKLFCFLVFDVFLLYL